MIKFFKSLPGKVLLFIVTWILGITMVASIIATAFLTLSDDYKTKRKNLIYTRVNSETLAYAIGLAKDTFNIDYRDECYDGNTAIPDSLKYRIVSVDDKKQVYGENTKAEFDPEFTYTIIRDVKNGYLVDVVMSDISEEEISNVIASYVWSNENQDEEYDIVNDTVNDTEATTEIAAEATTLEAAAEDPIESTANEEYEVIKDFGEYSVRYEKSDYASYYLYCTYNGDYSSFASLQAGLLIGDFVNANRYLIYTLAMISSLLFLAAYILLLCVSGRRKEEGLYPGFFRKVPTDLLLAATVILVFLLALWMDSLSFTPSNLYFFFILCCALGLIFLGLSMSLATRIKAKTLFKNTVIVWLICLLIKLCKWVAGKFHDLFENIPFGWFFAYLALFILLVIFEGIFLIGFRSPSYWFLKNVALFVVLLVLALDIAKLRKGTSNIAKGKVDYKIEAKKLHGPFIQQGEDLNHISDGISVAVEEQLKSERMKTELITNVSHDIKTPLTSIINYTDLLDKELTEEEKAANPKLSEYTEVLTRQSNKLKRLIEDLVEVSKASTGNLDVKLSICNAAVFLSQVAGEYKEKLDASNLELVIKGEDLFVPIKADGRRMLRVFDNLMNNICKYAQPGTRVYLNLADVHDTAVITFKNTSREELDVTPDELMERFVRGDKSRTTEGNGLGLAIARSMTELQGGQMNIEIDGDLFKVILRFPINREANLTE